jgi:hypothetical protein
VIQPGVGIEGLKLGMARKEAADFLKVTDFGKADERLYSRDLGLRVDFNKEGRAIQLQFIYRKTTWPFDGVTDKGVGKWCTVHDVIRGYGPPDSASDARNEKVPVLRYAASGIEFYFNEHGELTIVQVWAPEKPPGKK